MDKGTSLFWDKLISILLALLVFFFLLSFLYFIYLRMTKTQIPGLV